MLFASNERHPHLIAVNPQHGWIKETGLGRGLTFYYYIDMELCEFSLADYIQDEGTTYPNRGIPKRSPSDIIGIATQVVSGVVFIHDKQFIHRDLKPNNSIHICES